jgi:hypothetical protein
MHLMAKLFTPILMAGLVFNLLAPAVFAQAAGSDQPDLQAIDTFLQEQVKANRLPGVAVAIVQGDQVIFLKGYGEAAAGRPVTPQTQFYLGSVTKTFTALAAADLLNHLRLYWMLPRWTHKTASQPRLWLWAKVLAGILIPLGIIFGLPPLVQALQGGSASWLEPLKLAPDLTAWLLVGMGLNLARSAIHAFSLVRAGAV